MKNYTPEETAEEIGVSTSTLSRWRVKKVFVPDSRTIGGHSRYSQKQIDDLKAKSSVPKAKKYKLEDFL